MYLRTSYHSLGLHAKVFVIDFGEDSLTNVMQNVRVDGIDIADGLNSSCHASVSSKGAPHECDPRTRPRMRPFMERQVASALEM